MAFQNLEDEISFLKQKLRNQIVENETLKAELVKSENATQNVIGYLLNETAQNENLKLCFNQVQNELNEVKSELCRIKENLATLI